MGPTSSSPTWLTHHRRRWLARLGSGSGHGPAFPRPRARRAGHLFLMTRALLATTAALKPKKPVCCDSYLAGHWATPLLSSSRARTWRTVDTCTRAERYLQDHLRPGTFVSHTDTSPRLSCTRRKTPLRFAQHGGLRFHPLLEEAMLGSSVDQVLRGATTAPHLR